MTDRKCIHMTAEMARNCHVCNSHQMPADALEAQQCAVVKPLEWWESDTGDYCADTIFGRYQIQKVTANSRFRLFGPGCQIEPNDGYYWQFSDAKAAAQAHHDSCVLSTITIRPAVEVAAEAKAEAIEAAKAELQEAVDDWRSTGNELPAQKIEDEISTIDALHTDATRAALKRMKKGGE